MKEFETKRIVMQDYIANVPTTRSRLRAYFGHVEQGVQDDIRTPLFDGKPREEVLKEWEPILERVCAGWSSLLEFENDLRGKVGPLSVMKPLDERWDDIKAYYDCIHLSQTPISDDARVAFIKRWGAQIGGLRLRSPSATWNNMKKSTSSGCPYFIKRSDQYAKYGLGKYDNGYIVMSNGDRYKPTAILGWRGQEGGPDDSDVKQRVIWMFPMTLNLAELQFYQPLIEACQQCNLVPAWNGNDSVDKEMTLMFDSKGKKDVIICTDFSKFDQHFNECMQHAAYSGIYNLLTHNKESNFWLNEVWPEKYSIPLMCQSGELCVGDHGMGSGSGGTNADETIAHTMLQYEAAISAKSELNPHSMCLGDDGLLTYPGIELDHVLSTYTSHGLEMNESKQYVSANDATYLRRWYSTDYRVDGITRGVYSTYRALGKLMGQERFYDPKEWGPEMVVIRSLSIIENVKWHPARNEFLEFCVKGDKYKLGLDIPGFFDNLAKSYESNELAQSFKSYTAGDNVGINDWWVVKTLKAMR